MPYQPSPRSTCWNSPPSMGAAPVGNPPHTGVAPEPDLKKETVDTGALVRKRHRKRGLRSKCTTQGDEEGLCRLPSPTEYPRGKSLASMRIGTGTAVSAPATQEILVHTKGVSDPNPLSSSRKVVVTEDSNSEKSTSFTTMVGSPGSIYQPGWGMTNNCRLDTRAVCQDMVDHIVPLGYFSKLRHLPNDKFLNQYNTTLARQVAIGSQLRLRFDQETKLLKKAVAQVARQDKRIKARGKHIRNVEALLEAEVDMKGAAKAKNVELAKELESLCFHFLDLQVSNNQLSQEVSTLQAEIMGEERIKAAFKEFKKYEDDRVSSRFADGLSGTVVVMKCAESTELRQVFTDVVSVGIAKCMIEGLKHKVEHGKAKVDLAAIEAYDPEADTKYVAAFHALKDLKCPRADQLEKLKDALIDVIMTSLFLESDSREEAPQRIRELYPSSSQLRSRFTLKVGSTYHVRCDGVPLSVLIVALQGLVILLANAATQREIIEDETSPRLIRYKSLLPLYDLDCP
nr:hypothetical protein [Tanacetum cinerariifolium]